MTGELIDVAEVSFFELDALFARSQTALRRKLRRRRLKGREEAAGGDNRGRSRSPGGRAARGLVGGWANHGSEGRGGLPPFGGFTGKVGNVEKTVVVQECPAGVDERALWTHFAQCGVVSDVHILRDTHGVMTGVVLVEFDTEEAVARSIVTAGTPQGEIFGVVPKLSKASDQIPKGSGGPKRMVMTRQQFTQQVLSGFKSGGNPSPDAASMRKLHIKNLRPVVTEDDMRGIFKPFGEFEDFRMGEQECWITFKTHGDAQDATSSMQGFQLVGQELQITAQPAISATTVPPPPPPTSDILLSNILGKQAGVKRDTSAEDANYLDLKHDTDFEVSVGGATRADLMRKLMRGHAQGNIPTIIGGITGVQGGVSVPPPGSCAATVSPAAAVPPLTRPGGAQCKTMLLQNMFNPAAVNLQKEPRFYEELREDTTDECTKFGKVEHVTVDPRGPGSIYVLYEAPSMRVAAENALNGRWFEGKKILAQGIDDSIWQALAAQAQSTSK